MNTTNTGKAHLHVSFRAWNPVSPIQVETAVTADKALGGWNHGGMKLAAEDHDIVGEKSSKQKFSGCIVKELRFNVLEDRCA